jgi:hypothetical protein
MDMNAPAVFTERMPKKSFFLAKPFGIHTFDRLNGSRKKKIEHATEIGSPPCRHTKSSRRQEVNDHQHTTEAVRQFRLSGFDAFSGETLLRLKRQENPRPKPDRLEKNDLMMPGGGRRFAKKRSCVSEPLEGKSRKMQAGMA